MARNNNGGVGFLGLLTVALVVLKLLDKIQLGWWWVWAPMWIPFALLIAAFFIVLLGILLKEILSEMRRRKHRSI